MGVHQCPVFGIGYRETVGRGVEGARTEFSFDLTLKPLKAGIFLSEPIVLDGPTSLVWLVGYLSKAVCTSYLNPIQ